MRAFRSVVVPLLLLVTLAHAQLAAAQRPHKPVLLALKDGRPFLSFAVQGGDTQDQNLLQFFLNVVEFGMNVQQAAEAPNFNSYQMRASFGEHESQPGRLLLNQQTTPWVREELKKMGYTLTFEERTSGPINASSSIVSTAASGVDRAITAMTTGLFGRAPAPKSQSPASDPLRTVAWAALLEG